MDKRDEQIDRLLEQQCYILDILPRQVPAESDGQFFEVEHYFLNSNRRNALGEHFVNVILKLMCYFHAEILWDGWHDRPSPGTVSRAVYRLMENHSGTLTVLFPEEESLLVCDWDCIYLSVYHPSESMKALLPDIAAMEGLSFRKGVN